MADNATVGGQRKQHENSNSHFYSRQPHIKAGSRFWSAHRVPLTPMWGQAKLNPT